MGVPEAEAVVLGRRERMLSTMDSVKTGRSGVWREAEMNDGTGTVWVNDRSGQIQRAPPDMDEEDIGWVTATSPDNGLSQSPGRDSAANQAAASWGLRFRSVCQPGGSGVEPEDLSLQLA